VLCCLDNTTKHRTRPQTVKNAH